MILKLLELAQIAGVEDFGALGMEMFKVKSAVSGVPVRDLILRDYNHLICMEQKLELDNLKLLI